MYCSFRQNAEVLYSELLIEAASACTRYILYEFTVHATLARSCLKHYLTRILAGLMESQQENGNSFERLFELVSHLRRAHYVSVFVTPACTLDRFAPSTRLLLYRLLSAEHFHYYSHYSDVYRNSISLNLHLVEFEGPMIDIPLSRSFLIVVHSYL